MFDLAWSEIMLIALVAIVFIGPKELPAALRTFGKWASKARVMAAEFQRNVDDMVREAELEDVKKQFDEVRGIAANPTGALEKWVDPKGEIRGALSTPEFGGSLDKPGFDKTSLEKTSLEKPTLEKPTIDKPAPVDAPFAAPAVAAPQPAPVAPAPAAPVQSTAAPPVVAPPPAGAGTTAHAPAAATTTT